MPNLVLITFLVLSGCFVNTYEITEAATRQNFKIGESVLVHTLDNTLYEFTILEITPTAIVGKRQRIPFNEIQKLAKPRE